MAPATTRRRPCRSASTDTPIASKRPDAHDDSQQTLCGLIDAELVGRVGMQLRGRVREVAAQHRRRGQHRHDGRGARAESPRGSPDRLAAVAGASSSHRPPDGNVEGRTEPRHGELPLDRLGDPEP